MAEKLNINLAKWKRWSRSFLPPDPLGGLRSGYARQFTYRDAFTVYLGGYMVGMLGFNVPQACQILSALDDWLERQGYFALPGVKAQPHGISSQIRIFNLPGTRLGLEIRTYMKNGSAASGGICNEQYRQQLLNVDPDDSDFRQATHSWVIFIDHLHKKFMEQVAG